MSDAIKNLFERVKRFLIEFLFDKDARDAVGELV